ncbi:MAG: NAD(P)/FAD-dependent oxidoreductase [Myxococcota bacterium]
MSDEPSAEAVIVGAGVVGLACAASLARRGRSVLVLERNARAGLEASSRNSEVIHAGLYYPEGSLKAELCAEGRERLYRRCRASGVPHRRTGKLIVACEPGEEAALEALARRARANRAGDIELLDAGELKRREPRVRARAALWSPESGIVDAHALMDSYQAEAERHGATLVLRTRVTGLQLRSGPLWEVRTKSTEGQSHTIHTPCVVNAAGLESDRVAALAGLDPAQLGYRIWPCKGDYFAVTPSLGALCQTLVYPLPSGPGLGVHVTLDLGGRYRLGPDAEYVDSPRLDVDPAKAGRFAEAVARYLPEIRPEHITPDFAGLRAKLQGPGEGFRDFVVSEESSHGAPGLIDLLGIESPGLTAAGAIAERVAWLVDAQL